MKICFWITDKRRQASSGCLHPSYPGCPGKMRKLCHFRSPFAFHHLISHLHGCIMAFFEHTFGSRIMLTICILSHMEPGMVFFKPYLKPVVFRWSWHSNSGKVSVWEEYSTICVSDSLLLWCLDFCDGFSECCLSSTELQCKVRNWINVPSRNCLWCTWLQLLGSLCPLGCIVPVCWVDLCCSQVNLWEVSAELIKWVCSQPAFEAIATLMVPLDFSGAYLKG